MFFHSCGRCSSDVSVSSVTQQNADYQCFVKEKDLWCFWFRNTINLHATIIWHNIGSWEHRLHGLLNFGGFCRGAKWSRVGISSTTSTCHIIRCKEIVLGFVVLGPARCCSPRKGDNVLSHCATPQHEISSKRCAEQAWNGQCKCWLSWVSAQSEPTEKLLRGFRRKALRLDKRFSYPNSSKTLHNKKKQVQSYQCTQVHVA